MGIPQEKIYKLTIFALMQSLLNFNLHKGIKQSMKLLLICQKAQKPFNLNNYKAYINYKRKTSILASDKQSSIDLMSSQLTPGICAATTLQ